MSQSASRDIDDAPAVQLLQKILLDAIHLGASDLHFEPFEKSCRVRFRIDGLLRTMLEAPLAMRETLASRIKVLAQLDIAEKRLPQDGRMQLALSPTRNIDFRVSTLPTLYGEKVVIRILDASQVELNIDHLGYEEVQKAQLLDAIARPHGLILMTGPTGSGKTVSLYSCLQLRNEQGVNISSVEDPVEINLPGVNQVHINQRAGLSFPVALRAFLRQDPDILMVGEIRDLDTADIVIKAAQTGHLVFSTLHTNDAPASLIRLRNMGVPAFNIAASVILITAQRLVRRLCSCKQVVKMDKAMLASVGFNSSDLQDTWPLYRAQGCSRCGNSGYKGRIGIYQVMPISDAIAQLILAQGNTLQIAAQAQQEGVLSLRQAGLIKVRAGLTSLEEVLATTHP